MTDATAQADEPGSKSGKAGLIVGLVLALAGAAGGYVLATSGMIPFGDRAASPDAPPGATLPAVAFVDLAPIIVTVNSGGEDRHLRFHAQLEVDEHHAAEVERMRPRIMDVLNGYLRAIEPADLRDPLALTRLRGHMLRRIGIVLGEGRVRDVLVMEFVLN
ncbi:flagellar basal body protein FliL [Ruegeria sediminis]|uniref:Flagellar protein FliL n=1 Tax=Ruegeria sediminis TaxID=2583820 RepID=A0ABY2WVR6_9RHOB|nr:flagellar basal body-associated FliL family protein [Ruegeria sediminis]TMV06851.1 flagellar basal body protein FliL [Ruegeria sediminis]